MKKRQDLSDEYAHLKQLLDIADPSALSMADRLKLLDVVQKQAELKANNAWYKSPLLLSLVTSLIAILSGILAAFVNGKNSQALQREQYQASLILKAVEPLDEETKVRNLDFLIKAEMIEPNDYIQGLVNQYNEVIDTTSDTSHVGQTLPVVIPKHHTALSDINFAPETSGNKTDSLRQLIQQHRQAIRILQDSVRGQSVRNQDLLEENKKLSSELNGMRKESQNKKPY